VTISRFSFPTPIVFGAGARDLVAPHLWDAGVRRPLVVTDNGISGLAMFTDILANLAAGGMEPVVFDGVWGNPVKSQVLAGAAAFNDGNCDGIVGVGGGAALDVAKAIGVAATHSADLFAYEDEVPGALPVEDRIPYFVAIPTTAGTGSEVGRSAVIADDDTHVKKIIFSPHLLARTVFADPELTVGLPAGITAATGMDALTHNIEAYLAAGYHPIADGIALEGLHLVAEFLPTAVDTPADLDARGGMLMASMMGAIAFQKGLGVVHSCAHALGTVADLHHGLANAVMIDHALAVNVDAVPERFVRMARTVGIDDETPEGFLSWLADLKASISMPAHLVDVSVDAAQLDDLVRVAVADGCHLNNAVPVSADDFRTIFERAFG
jgi:alcohol dehydrogenase class IV